MASDRPGEFERFAFEKALDAAWTTEFWIPGDPDYRFTDYFEAAVTRNLGLLEGFEHLAADIQQRAILPQSSSDQAQLVTDGGQYRSPLADVDGLEEIEVECAVAIEEPDACDGWKATIDLDDPAEFHPETARISLPGFGWECPECGQPHEFEIEGIRVSNLV